MIATTSIDAMLDAAECIPGWMTTSELAWLYDQATLYTRILEVGSYRGRSTLAMAMATRGTVHCVDDFRGERSTPDHVGADLSTAFATNLWGYLESGKVTVFPMAFAAFHAAWAHDPRPRWDMIFIDGTHEPAEAVAEDCRFALEMLAPGGLICGHDWGVGKVIEGLSLALSSARPVGAHTIWAVWP